MNTYEYRCENCQHTFETEQHFKDKPLKKCPKCKKHKLERLISAPAVINMGPKTLGTMAEKKTAKMGKYAREKLEHDSAQRREAADNEIQRQAEKMGGKPLRPKKKDTPWYRKNSKTSLKKIAKMAEKQKQDYIATGKTV